MTPKEKAKDLVKGFRSTFIILVTNTKGELQFPYKSKYVANEVFEHQSKQCAIECVDEIIESIRKCDDYWYGDMQVDGVSYWQKVKKELENF